MEFPGGSLGSGPGVVSAVAQVAAVAQVWFLAWELPYAVGKAKIKNKQTKKLNMLKKIKVIMMPMEIGEGEGDQTKQDLKDQSIHSSR